MRPGRFGRWVEAGSNDLTTDDLDELRVARNWVSGIVVALGSFVLYLLTTARYQIAGDTTDFLIAGKTSGVAHAPGYPTLVVLAHLFSYLPIGSTAFRMDLLAAVCSTITVALVYATGLYLTRRPWTAAGAALALAITPLFWKWSLVLETFPLNSALVAAIVYLLVRWHYEPERAGFVYGAALAFGLGLTNQQTVALLIPAIGLMLWWHRGAIVRRPAIIGWSALAIFVGLLPYVYVPIAAAGSSPENWDRVRSLSAFVNMIKRQDYGGTGFAAVSAHATGTYVLTLAYFFVEIGLVMGVLALGGAIVAFVRQRWYLLFVALAFATTLLEFTVVAGLNPKNPSQLFVLERFYLMPLVILAPLGALALSWITDWVSLKLPATSKAGQSVPVAIFAALAAICAVSVATNYSTNNVSTDKVTDQFARSILTGLQPHSILFVTQDFADFPVLYAHAVEGVRPDVSVVISPILAAPWYQQSLRDAGQVTIPTVVNTLNLITANPSRPIAFFGDPPDQSLAKQYYLAQQGLTYNLEPTAVNIGPEQFAAQNAAALATYQIPAASSIKSVSYELAILDSYGNVAAAVGHQYMLWKMPGKAVSWFQRAHEIDPSNRDFAAALAKAEQG